MSFITAPQIISNLTISIRKWAEFNSFIHFSDTVKAVLQEILQNSEMAQTFSAPQTSCM